MQVLKTLIGIQRAFLWSGGDDCHKVAWVKWSVVCQPKKEGGLGVKDLDLFNLSLLGKWKWRFMTEPNAIWRNLLSHRYGKIDNLFHSTRGNQNMQSFWWRDIQRLDSAHPSLHGWFTSAVRRKVLNGKSTLFWHDTWLSDVPLKILFPRLFSISSVQDCMVADFGLWRGDLWCWNCSWRRNLFAWEVDLQVQLQDTLAPVVVSRDGTDGWVWLEDPSKSYSVKICLRLHPQEGASSSAASRRSTHF